MPGRNSSRARHASRARVAVEQRRQDLGHVIDVLLGDVLERADRLVEMPSAASMRPSIMLARTQSASAAYASSMCCARFVERAARARLLGELAIELRDHACPSARRSPARSGARSRSPCPSRVRAGRCRSGACSACGALRVHRDEVGEQRSRRDRAGPRACSPRPARAARASSARRSGPGAAPGPGAGGSRDRLRRGGGTGGRARPASRTCPCRARRCCRNTSIALSGCSLSR